MTDSDPRVEQLLSFVRSEFLARTGIEVDARTPLVSGGIIDSLALVTLLLKLEEITGASIPADEVQPKDMDSVLMMIELADRYR